MSGNRAASHCGLTSLLPMSCRGRAAAFARDLHSRLRNLGTAADDDCESSWLARDSPAATRPTTSNNQRDLDTYDFELECESPSSPVDEIDHTFLDRSPTEDREAPFYDVASESEAKEQAKLIQYPDKTKNGFRFSTALYSDSSPVKAQPVPRENGHSEKQLYSAITFEGCARQNSFDEIDCALKPSSVTDNERLRLPLYLSSTLDSDSEFESAKSDPSDCAEEAYHNGTSLEDDITEVLGNQSIEAELQDEEVIEIAEIAEEVIEQQASEVTEETSTLSIEIITSEVPIEVEVSPTPEIEPTLLHAKAIEEDQKETIHLNETEEHNEAEKQNKPERQNKAEDQNEAEDDKPQRVRRCSSLKTGKTPPGTPGRKKMVRFADVLGLDLADVKTFMDEIPVIPKSAYDDLTECDVASSPPVRAPPRLGALTLVPLFQLPSDFNEKLGKLNVCMESARVCDGVHVTVCGSVRVRNLDFHKTVHVRYTMNNWRTYTDLQANYVQGSCDGFSDRFQFVLYAPAILSGQRLQVAVRFQCKGQQFWDNNAGTNYCFDCLALGAMQSAAAPAAGPLHPTVEWHPSFY